jgi:hypothetical protein
MEDSFILWLRDTFVCSNLDRMFVGNARWQKETPPNQSGLQHSSKTLSPPGKTSLKRVTNYIMPPISLTFRAK